MIAGHLPLPRHRREPAARRACDADSDPTLAPIAEAGWSSRLPRQMVWQLDPAAAAPRERGRYAAPEPPHQQSYELRRSTPQELVARERARSELAARERARSLSDSARGELVTRTEETRGPGRGHWTDFTPPQTRGGAGAAAPRDEVPQRSPPAPSPKAPPRPHNPDLIVIHVCDEARKVSRDFACDRVVLLREMRYFRSYLGGGGACEDIDISVHCDVHIFEWLVQWIHSPNKPPPLDASSVVSILISSEFLEMANLVEHCLKFMAAHVGEILEMPIDLACVSDALVQRLAALCPAEVLCDLTDAKDKLLPKLYKRRLELDFRHSSKSNKRDILKCRHCDRLYPAWAQTKLSCAKAPPRIDRRGHLCLRHEPVEERWSLTEYVGELHAAGMPWEEVYWNMWAATHIFRCTVCDAWFGAADMENCRHHPGPQEFGDDHALRGKYACCGAECLRFAAGVIAKGCAARQHAVSSVDGSASPQTLALLEKRDWARTVADEEPVERASSSERSRAATPVPEPPEPAPVVVRPPEPAAEPAEERPESQERPASQEAPAKEEAKPEEPKLAAKIEKKIRKKGAAKKKLANAVKKANGAVKKKLDLAAAAAKALEDEAARKRAAALKAKAAAERARRLFSVFGAAPDGTHAPMDHEHPLARGKAAKRSDDAAALSPRRRRAYEMDCGWRLEDQERMGQLARALVERRTPLAGALARADQQDEEVKVEKKAEAKRWR